MTTLLTGGSVRGEALDDDVDLARDRVLVTRAQDGDRAAFDDLYLRYYRRLYRFCLRRLHDTHEAEDVAQEAFSRAWRALPGFGGDRRFYPWLSVIASHLCTDVLRRRNRSTPVAEFHQGNVASTEDGGEELMLASVDCDLVAKAFQRLSERHQRILNLREGSGWSYQRIADHEGVGITAVETLLWRARQALKREFAALAGADSRMAAWTGGLLSLSMLRKLLKAPVHAARRLGHVAPASAVALGSAAAATAVMVATGVGTASHAVPPATPAPPAHVAAAAVTPAATPVPLGGLRSAAAHDQAASANGSPLVPLAPSLSLPAGSSALPGAVPGLGNAGNVSGFLTNVGSQAAAALKSPALADVTASAGKVISDLLVPPASTAGTGASSSDLGALPGAVGAMANTALGATSLLGGQ